MARILTLGRQCELPTPPAEIADEVELYARESGRTGRLEFVPIAFRNGRIADGIWRARFSLRPSDKRLSLYQEGRTGEVPTEDVWFRVKGMNGEMHALDITQLGASGVRNFLEKGNAWSGRGEFSSLEDQLRRVRAHNEATQDKVRTDARTEAQYEARDTRRSRLKIPVVPVGIDVGSTGESSPLEARPTQTKE
jgi:hypothetical protein